MSFKSSYRTLDKPFGEALDDAIDRWHELAMGNSLQRYLGLTDEEYQLLLDGTSKLKDYLDSLCACLKYPVGTYCEHRADFCGSSEAYQAYMFGPYSPMRGGLRPSEPATKVYGGHPAIRPNRFYK